MLSDRHLEGRYENVFRSWLWCASRTRIIRTATEKKRPIRTTSARTELVWLSKRPWRPGEYVEVFSSADALTARAKVVYCRQVKSDFYFIA